VCQSHLARKYIYKKEEQPMKKIAYIGVDYHLHSLSIAVMVKDEKKSYDLIRFGK
jgi:hypothetical protein